MMIAVRGTGTAWLGLGVAAVVGCAVDWSQYERLSDGSGGTGAGAAGGSGGTAGHPGSGGSGGLPTGTGGSIGEPSRRRQLSLTDPPEPLVDFPLLVVLNATRIDYAATGDAGQDLRFFAADATTPLSHEIELWDEAGTSFVWVKIPAYTAGTAIWMYYGDPAAMDAQDPAGVWSSGYAAVWHMNGAVADSTANGNHGSVVGTADAAAQIGMGQLFDQAGDHVNIGAPASLASVFASGGTVMAWIRPLSNGLGATGSRIIDKTLNVTAQGGWSLEINAGSYSLEAGFTNGSWDWKTADGVLSFAGMWQHVAAVYLGTDATPQVFYNGATIVVTAQDAGVGTIDPDADTVMFLGNRPTAADRTFDGIIDEVRIATVPRTAGWIMHQYASMSDKVVTFGVEERVP